MRVTYYDEFTRLTRLKPPYAWALRAVVAGTILVMVAMVL